jgi:hypothetical protein
VPNGPSIGTSIFLSLLPDALHDRRAGRASLGSGFTGSRREGELAPLRSGCRWAEGSLATLAMHPEEPRGAVRCFRIWRTPRCAARSTRPHAPTHGDVHHVCGKRLLRRHPTQRAFTPPTRRSSQARFSLTANSVAILHPPELPWTLVLVNVSSGVLSCSRSGAQCG